MRRSPGLRRRLTCAGPRSSRVPSSSLTPWSRCGRHACLPANPWRAGQEHVGGGHGAAPPGARVPEGAQASVILPRARPNPPGAGNGLSGWARPARRPPPRPAAGKERRKRRGSTRPPKTERGLPPPGRAAGGNRAPSRHSPRRIQERGGRHRRMREVGERVRKGREDRILQEIAPLQSSPPPW